MTGNVATLGGTAPAGRGMVYHAGRGWIWGANANQSRLYYSASGNVEDWVGADTGSIDVAPEDGDRIVGVLPNYKKKLIVFKGPNRGSIHVISGTAPTGSDAFALSPMVSGIPLQSHNSLVPIGDDAAFASNRGIHLLSAVQEFGDFGEKDVTRYLKKFFRSDINRTKFGQVWGVNYSAKSCALWTFTANGATENNLVLGLSYVRFEEEGFKPFTWRRDCFSAALRKHPTTLLDEVVFGGTDGFCRRQDTDDRNIDSSTAYTLHMQSPKLMLASQDSRGKPMGDQPFALNSIYMRSVAMGDYDVQMTVIRDKGASDSYAFNQGFEGFLLDTDFLDVGILGGDTMQIEYSDPPASGQARAVQLDILQGGYNQDAHIIEIGIGITPTAPSTSSDLE